MNAEPSTTAPRRRVETVIDQARLPAVRSSETSLDDVARLGMWLAAAESESRDPKALGAAAALRLAFARELGLPLTAASEVHVIRGRLSLGALLLRALAEEQGFVVRKTPESDRESCTAVISREGEELGRVTWSTETATARGLLPAKAGSGWARNPDRMLWARASTDAIRDFAPRVAVGLLVTEELDEVVDVVEPQPTAPAAAPLLASGGHGASYEPDPEPIPGVDEPAPPPDVPYDEAGNPDDPAVAQEAEAREKAAEVVPWDRKQQRRLFAMLGELDKSFEPPIDPEVGIRYGDWKSVAVETADKRWGKDLKDLSYDEAEELIKRVDARLKELRGEQQPPTDPAEGDIPY